MTPQELQEIRKATGLTQKRFAQILGYADGEAYRKFEQGARDMPFWLPKMAEMIRRHGIPSEWLGEETPARFTTEEIEAIRAERAENDRRTSEVLASKGVTENPRLAKRKKALQRRAARSK